MNIKKNSIFTFEFLSCVYIVACKISQFVVFLEMLVVKIMILICNVIGLYSLKLLVQTRVLKLNRSNNYTPVLHYQKSAPNLRF